MVRSFFWPCVITFLNLKQGVSFPGWCDHTSRQALCEVDLDFLALLLHVRVRVWLFSVCWCLWEEWRRLKCQRQSGGGKWGDTATRSPGCVCVSTGQEKRRHTRVAGHSVAMTDEHPAWCRQPDASPLSPFSVDNTLCKYFHGLCRRPRHRKLRSKTSQRARRVSRSVSATSPRWVTARAAACWYSYNAFMFCYTITLQSTQCEVICWDLSCRQKTKILY